MRETKKQLAAQNQDLSRWQQWRTDLLADARGIERAYVGNGMKSVTLGILSDVFATFVFIF